MGKFIWQIPFMVIVSLTLSLFESFFLLPVRYSQFAGNNQKKNPNSIRSKIRNFMENGFQSVRDKFTRFITKVVANPFITLGSIMGIFVGSILLLGVMNFNLFPKEGIDYILIIAEFPPDFTAGETAK